MLKKKNILLFIFIFTFVIVTIVTNIHSSEITAKRSKINRSKNVSIDKNIKNTDKIIEPKNNSSKTDDSSDKKSNLSDKNINTDSKNINLNQNKNVKYDNISIGKFYNFNVKPDELYPDIYKNEFTDGTKLSDGEIGNNSSNNFVGWNKKDVEITLDLGKTTSISNIKISAFVNTSKKIYSPKIIQIKTSLDKVNWSNYGTDINISSNSNDETKFKTIEGNGGTINSRYIKYIIYQSIGYTIIDEIWAEGKIINTRKKVPQNECYYGAYAESNDLNGWMNVNDYENLTRRKLNMSLWYSDWNTSFNNSVRDVVLTNLKDKNIYLELGFLPYNATSYDIATGKYDEFLKNWFIECKNLNYPIWIRPMNEMNGKWTFQRNNADNKLIYGGDPANYKKAWRRMYNIAEQVGAVGENQIFLWSPDARSEEGHNMSNYYPGNQYVDWVGVSAYVDKINKSGNFETLDNLVNEVYTKYSNIKPVMISEGGAFEVSNTKLKANWIEQWFNITKKKEIKAAVWFHKHEDHPDGSKTYGTRIDSSKDSINAYRP